MIKDTITMTDESGLLRLMAWLSPAFPTGGFAYSSGLETAVQSSLISDQNELMEWLAGLLQHGSTRNDAILLTEAWHRHNNKENLQEVVDLALSLAGSAERYLEMTAQGEAFAQGIRHWPDTADVTIPTPCPLPIAIGIAASCSKLDLQQVLSAYLQSFVTNQVQAGIRLSLIGQRAAAQVLAELEPVILATSLMASKSSLENLGSATFTADIMAMKHEELAGRMFRS